MTERHRSLPHGVGVQPRTVRPTRVVIADDECMFRASLRQLLAVPAQVVQDVYGVAIGSGFEVVGEAGTGQETVERVRALEPDLLLLDISMPRQNGLEALRELRPSLDRTRVILLSATADQPHLLTAIRLGARGVVQKDSATELLFEAMMQVLGGQSWIGPTLISDLVDMVRSLADSEHGKGIRPFGLTPRERQVLAL